jgi:hypothetical protein
VDARGLWASALRRAKSNRGAGEPAAHSQRDYSAVLNNCFAASCAVAVAQTAVTGSEPLNGRWVQMPRKGRVGCWALIGCPILRIGAANGGRTLKKFVSFRSGNFRGATSLGRVIIRRSLKEQPKRGRPENACRKHGWDNPGQPGKRWRQLVPLSPPRQGDLRAGMSHQFLWPESCPVSPPTNQELCGQARSETAPNRVRSTGSFDRRIDTVTQRVMVATVQTRTLCCFRRSHPRHKARHPLADAQRKRDDGEGADRAKFVNLPHRGGLTNQAAQLQSNAT